ncbi:MULTISPECIES: endonuclease/exonuclease/phosphatase family protein [unclassified Avibacterium]|uniref:endonuclease/exonuclease/phosphatase family protein n=1 Tax=unclassified Avibacterium TaxID=2685287 RepID=UPI00202649CB|nr:MULTISPECIES: endonuclease/exonuclease/phosphatase family protein [unclassified Avibacterium]MCW9697927.1 endonuclease/exonuclease/phosphatase family protein [Avibacterium sp. 20-129]URL05742.1 endonuclease/exonuclease/phosphatase family protein [Avibacterium sp. 21-595]
MSKLKSFFIALLGMILLGLGYLWHSLEIYPVPQIQFHTKSPLAYQRKALDSAVTCFYTEQSVKPIEQQNFRLLVWNMHKGQDKGWQNALSRFAKASDFLFLQEVSSEQHLAQQFSQQFPTALYASSFAYLGKQSGVMLMSHFQPQSFCAGSSVEPWIRIPKVGNAMRFPLANGQSLLTINLHLVNFELNPVRYQQQLEAMFKLIKSHQGPIILAGDFNAWNSGRINLIKKLTALYGLVPVSFQPDDRLRFLANPLDWVFVRGFNVKSARTMQTTSSDHNPLLVELTLLKPQP